MAQPDLPQRHTRREHRQPQRRRFHRPAPAQRPEQHQRQVEEKGGGLQAERQKGRKAHRRGQGRAAGALAPALSQPETQADKRHGEGVGVEDGAIEPEPGAAEAGHRHGQGPPGAPAPPRGVPEQQNRPVDGRQVQQDAAGKGREPRQAAGDEHRRQRQRQKIVVVGLQEILPVDLDGAGGGDLQRAVVDPAEIPGGLHPHRERKGSGGQDECPKEHPKGAARPLLAHAGQRTTGREEHRQGPGGQQHRPEPHRKQAHQQHHREKGGRRPEGQLIQTPQRHCLLLSFPAGRFCAGRTPPQRPSRARWRRSPPGRRTSTSNR